MTDRPDDISPEMGVLAAEYVLGVLSDDTRAAFEQRLRHEPGLVAEVRRWEAYFATLAEIEVEDVAPPARVRAALEAELFGAAPQSASAGASAAVSLWNRVALWRGIGLAGLATSAVLALLLLLPAAPPPTAIGDRFVAQIASEESGFTFVAFVDAGADTLTIRRAAGDPAPGRAQELWAILGDNAPVSLGLLAEDGTAVLPLPEALRPVIGQVVLAVSDEPPGGSPTGAPTGAVLAAGGVVAL